MKTIMLNNQPLNISAQEERALYILKHNDFVAKADQFVEGRGRYKHSILPSIGRAETLGIYYPDNPEKISNGLYESIPVRVKQFFKNNPRCWYCAAGKPQRINTILKKLEGEGK